jgi:hypothetical protein
MSKNNSSTLVFVFLIAAVLVIGCSDMKKSGAGNATVAASPAPASPGAPSTPTSTQKAPQPPSGPAVGVTMENFKRLKNGMKYSEVVAILGKEGEEVSSSDVGGTSTVMYKWDGDEGGFGANMNAMFQNGKMMSKAQFGLK